LCSRDRTLRGAALAAGRRSTVPRSESCSVNQSVKQSLGGALLAYYCSTQNDEPNRTRPSFAVVSALEPPASVEIGRASCRERV
jgi:hypothetical protein